MINQLQLGQLGNQQCASTLQAQNCVASQQLGGYIGYQQCYETRYVDRYVHADVAIDKVENGFVVTIKGKRFIAKKAVDIAALVEGNL